MNSLVHRVHRTDGMMKTRMQGTRINHVGHAELLDPSQALKPWVFYQVEQKLMADRYEAINGIVKDFSAIERGMPH